MKIEIVNIDEVLSNPDNPRIIQDDKFKKLVQSIKEFPKMLEIRPIVVDENNIVLGGNMRLKACKEAGLKEIHIIRADDLNEDQKNQFIVKDNASFGEWDFESLSNDFDISLLADWGVDVPYKEIPLEYIEKETVNENDFEKITSEHSKTPIVSKLTKRHSLFVIPVDEEIDEIYIREMFGLNEPRMFGKIKGKSSVITIEMIQQLISKLCNV